MSFPVSPYQTSRWERQQPGVQQFQWSLVQNRARMSFILCSLPAEVVGQHALSLLSYKDVGKLDSAVLCKTSRNMLHGAFHCTTISNWLIGIGTDCTSIGVEWCVKRGIRVENPSISSRVHEVIQCLSNHPWLLKGELKLSCSHQDELDMIQDGLVPCTNALKIAVAMSFFAEDESLVFRDISLFSGRLSSFNWDTRAVSSQHADQLVRSNPQLHRLVIFQPGSGELRSMASLGLSLQDLTLLDVTLDDVHLASLAHSCPMLKRLFLGGIEHSHQLQGGVIAVAENCRVLEAIEVQNFPISEVALNALCMHCSKLKKVQIPSAPFTIQSVALLNKSRAQVRKLAIGWAVDAAPETVLTTQCFESVRELDISAVTPTNTSSLAHAISNMMELKSLTVSAAWNGNQFPALVSAQVDILARALQNCTKLTQIRLRKRLRTASRESICRVFESCRGLTIVHVDASCTTFSNTMVQSLAAHCPGLVNVSITAMEDLSDDAMAVLAAQCPLLSKLRIDDAPGLTDVALHALAEHCPCLVFLYLWQSERLTLDGIRHLVQHCTKLAHLSVPNSCMRDGEKEIHKVLRKHRNRVHGSLTA